MASIAAFRLEWSSVSSLIIWTRCPNASTWARSPARNPPTRDRASRFAWSRRLPARMLSELSMATTVMAPERPEGRTVREM